MNQQPSYNNVYGCRTIYENLKHSLYSKHTENKPLSLHTINYNTRIWSVAHAVHVGSRQVQVIVSNMYSTLAFNWQFISLRWHEVTRSTGARGLLGWKHECWVVIWMQIFKTWGVVWRQGDLSIDQLYHHHYLVNRDTSCETSGQELPCISFWEHHWTTRANYHKDCFTVTDLVAGQLCRLES